MNKNVKKQNSRLNLQKLFWTGSLISGVMLGLNAPGLGTHWLGLISLFPLIFTLEQLHTEEGLSFRKRALLFFGICWLTGGIAASIGSYWITNSIHVFGHAPWSVALMITGVGYGLEVGFQLFVYFGIPLLLIRKLNNWDLPLRLAFVLALDPWYPRLIHWNYGGLTFSEFPWIEQLADIIGSSGLLLFSSGLAFLLIGWLRWKSGKISHKKILQASNLYLLLWIIGLSYGAWRTYNLETKFPETNPNSSNLTVLVIQPNFSLQDLASNAELAHSKRQQNLESLLNDSRKALAELPQNTSTEKLLVWPESVFPDAYFKSQNSRHRVSSFAQEHQANILFATVDWEPTQTGHKFYGVSVLVGKNGEVLGRYNKIFLIPFGEMIPFSDWFPGIAAWLRQNIANMSEFDRGSEYTVFSLADNTQLSAPICFDIFNPTVMRGMVRNGSDLVLNLSNLAWFGRTTASDNMVATLRWRAIENRVPVVFASNNGESLFIAANGKNMSQQLGLFEEGTLTSTVQLQSQFSFYREYAEWVWAGFIFLFLLLLIPTLRPAKIFQ
ncbi:MAG: apolipoprotein N-acyltransferase [Proteobacteria bacterium]|jgi:apolipoprotein N-acyltransferase|nr:apolipoprotein N-acyltransferase [Pseudomonadota bacterium]MBT5793403.1 apolipoprotein N-acyltransferase [Deltaproteobacteria bacterium]